jgi:hypothetical protein
MKARRAIDYRNNRLESLAEEALGLLLPDRGRATGKGGLDRCAVLG